MNMVANLIDYSNVGQFKINVSQFCLYELIYSVKDIFDA